jgi:TRAP-type C4-dicarboxylate transport system substrate-binding protein
MSIEKGRLVVKLNIAIFFILIFLTGFTHSQVVIKFATQAPEGSAWIKVMEEYNKQVQELTNGQVKFKIYPGGIQGDELGVLRKIRFGSLQSAGFTGVGAGEVLPEFRILEAPMLIRTYQEADYITSLLYDELAKKFEENGFVLLGLTEVGFVYVFGQKPITSISDLKNVKMWMWEGDPLAEAVFKSMGANAIPLSITDVLTSLQTNLIEAVYTSPLACVTLQWYTRVKYMMDVPLTNSFGAILLSKKTYDKIQPEYQKILVEKGRENMKRLVQLSRQSNQESIELMKKNGIQIVKIPEANLKGFHEAARKARNDLVGKLYSAELLSRVEKALQDLRAGKVSTQ